MSTTAVGHGAPAARIDSIDGLRAIAVVAVIAFHTDAWLPGGYLGVSVFFTISGFVIGRNLFAEHQRSNSINLRQFYGRRLRRLIPASLLCVLFVILTQAIFAAYDVTATRRELPWVLLPVYNWYQLAEQHTYADIFSGAQSPFVHYWSLAIEEQIYLILPLAVLAMLRLTRRPAIRRSIVLGTTVAFAALPLAVHAISGPQSVYYATYARVGEVLVGVAAAWLISHHPTHRRWSAVGWTALIAIVAAMAMTGANDDAWPYRGGLALAAIATACVIAGCVAGGHLAGALATRPLAYIGRISYGIYLFHWPLALIIAHQLPDATRPTRFALTTAMSIALAAISFAAIEMPIQRLRRVGTWRTLAVSVAGAVAVLAIGAVAVRPENRPTTDTAAYDEERAAAVNLSDGASAGAAPAADTTTTISISRTSTVVAGSTVVTEAPTTSLDATPPQPAALRVLLTGDSTAVALGEGVIDFLFANPTEGSATVVASGACGLLTGGELRDKVVDTGLQMYCPRSRLTALSTNAEAHPDAVVVMITLADSWPRSWDGRKTWLKPTDAEFLDRLRSDYAVFAERALADTSCVVWVRPAKSWVRRNGRFRVEPPHADGSQEQVNAAVDELVAQHPGRMAVIDLNTYFQGRGDPGKDGRPDGLHLDRPAAGDIAATWLWPQLRAAGVGSGSCQTP